MDVREILAAMNPSDRARVLAQASSGVSGVGSWLSSLVRTVAPIVQAIPGVNTSVAPIINTLFPPQAAAPTAAPQAQGGSNWLVPALIVGGGLLFLTRRR